MFRKHWTPRYIYDRIKLYYYQRNNPEYPWLVNRVMAFLELYLKNDDVGLEFGSGRSTLWFAKKVKHITSIEHDSKWYQWVSEQIKAHGLSNKVDYHLFANEAGKSASCKYVDIIDTFNKDSFDFVLIDGMSRDICALKSLDTLKKGGIIIIDNVNWYIPRRDPSRAPNSRGVQHGFASDQWRDFYSVVAGWRGMWESDGITDTALWFKE